MLELKISQGGTETHYGQINKSIILKLKKKKQKLNTHLMAAPLQRSLEDVWR